MATRLKIICFGVVLYISGISANSFDLQCRLDKDDQTVGGKYDITIQIKASESSFAMGSANFVFSYNTNAFQTSEEANPPALHTASNFSGGNYNIMTLTEPVLGRLSLNIDLMSENNGTTVSEELINIATIRFTIKDPAESGQFTWRTASPNGVVVFADDQATRINENSLAGESAFAINFESGWNMIGLPNDAHDKQETILFPGASPNTLFSFNGSYFQVNSLALGNGYWLNYPSPTPVAVTGFGVNCVELNLEAGWNLISGPSCNVAIEDISDPGGIIVSNTIFGYSGSYVLVDSLKQGEGYWVNTNQAGQIVIKCGAAGGAKSTNKSGTSFLADRLDVSALPQLHFADATANKQTLYFNAALPDPAVRHSYRLPPTAPPGIHQFDVRFYGDFRLSENVDEMIYLQAVHYPVNITAANLNAAGESQYIIRQIAGNTQLSSSIISEDNSIEIIDTRIDKLQLSKVENAKIPVKFMVNQNYPNPFNPSTAIRYGLPKSEFVTIIIFNTLGQKVRTLVNGQREAGFHSAVWDSRNDAGEKVGSGIYVYRVYSGRDFITKKMILLK